MKIGDLTIGESVFIIAEIGLNHDGSVERAIELVDAAKKAGAHAVKFQKRDLASLYPSGVIEGKESADQSVETLIPALIKCELSEEELDKIRQHCENTGIMFFFTPFDEKSADILEGKVPCYKIASADCGNLSLLEYVAKKGKPLILSTGMTQLDHVKKVVAFLQERKVEFMLNHCISGYPPGTESLNLNYLKELQKLGVLIGYSAHELEPEYSLVAVAMGAVAVEKHITYDRNAPGPDHKASLTPEEFAEAVQLIKQNLSYEEILAKYPHVKESLGTGERVLTREEELSKIPLQKSIYLKKDVAAGSTLTKEDLWVRGPGGGMNPITYYDVVGKELKRDAKEGEALREAHFEEKSDDWPREFKQDWGFKLRPAEAEGFRNENMPLFEFHMSPADIVRPFKPEKKFKQRLVVHTAEILPEDLGFSGTDTRSYVDMCSSDEEVRKASVEMMKRTIKKTKEMAPYFEGIPKVVIHVGGYATTKDFDDELRGKMFAHGVDSFAQLDKEGVILLPENMPPFPTHASARCYQAFFSKAEDLVKFCQATKLKACFDTSHAQLYCNAYGGTLLDYAKKVLPYTDHLHIADSSGIDGEGLQIGDGMVDFPPILDLFKDKTFTWVGEITNGHKDDYEGFKEANRRLKKLGQEIL
ncbi:hypothetical protein CMO91_05560 [Candidatus Woesearchaeota archaeon]|nr:hypothetical protein [Candidatus Woesearchaeota archaeon]